MVTDWIKVARRTVQAMQPYQAGKPLEEAQRELGLTSLVKLASNENPHGPSARVLNAMTESLSDCNRYPDANGYYLKSALASKFAVDVEAITLGNGSNDILELVASAFLDHNSSAVYSQYAFVVYALAVARSGAAALVAPATNYGHDLDAMLALVQPNTKVVYLANPNNPTGTYFSHNSLAVFLRALRSDIVVVLDEAYYEYAHAADYPDGQLLQRSHPNLILTRTFSKAYGLSGLRVGYSLSHPVIADVLNRVRQPFNVTSPSLLGAQVALDDDQHLQQGLDTNRAGMEQITTGLDTLGLEAIPSAANFVTFAPGIDAARVNQALLERGVILRPLANYHMPKHLRVSIGLEHENQKFLNELPAVLCALK